MAAAAEIGKNPLSKHQIQPEQEISRLTRDGTAEPVLRVQILRHERGQGNIHFPCSADHEQDWQPYPVDHTYSRSMHQPGKVANPARGQLNRKNEDFPVRVRA